MIGWIDFSQAERDRAASVLKLVKEQGSIDELGIGAIRDGFADLFFPGTSTLHTFPRYLFLISYDLKDLERYHAGEPAATLEQTFEREESHTAEKLVAWASTHRERGDTEGIIGATRLTQNAWVKQTPSQMYWAALCRYGFLTGKYMSRRELFKLIADEPSHSDSQRARYEDEESDVAEEASGLWGFPLESYQNWNQGETISMKLTASEASFLHDRIIAVGPERLYADLLRTDQLGSISDEIAALSSSDLSFIEFVNHHADGALVSSGETRENCELAADVSSLIALLHIRFNYIIQQAAGSVPEGSRHSARDQWEIQFEGENSDYKDRALSCDLEKMFHVLDLDKTHKQSDKMTRDFLKYSLECLKDGSAVALANLDDCIKKREKNLKGPKRSKTANPSKYCDSWYGGLALTYRFETAMRFAAEILSALGGDSIAQH